MKRTKFFLIPTKGRDTTNSAKRESEPVVEPDNPLTGSMGLGGFGDIFDSFFGSSSGNRRQAQRGSDLQHRVLLSFEESVFGAEREVELTRLENCSTFSRSRQRTRDAPRVMQYM
ncbi:MAG: hypothetical protein Ct9H300mP11_31760 [Chloroflexota bacterium]|nr:MAG: hypothetical protein Ct9H300mP11_31760 [Chloroflexota bacterium]